MTNGPPKSVEQALAKARQHTQRALGEAIAAARALLDAASLATSGQAVSDRGALGALARGLDELARDLGSSESVSSPLFEALLDALDAEIARWQTRAEADRDARAVLRAFLGIREILWEMGVRRHSDPPTPEQPASRRESQRAPQADPAGPRRRVQRVEVRG